MNQQILFSLSSVKKYYPVLGGILKREVGRVNVINGIDLTIESGATIGLVGESGCGKSTLAKLLIKLEEPSSGDIRFKGESLKTIKRERKKEFYQNVQMVFQDPYSSLNPRLKIGQIVGEMIRIQGRSKKREREAVLSTLNLVGLSSDAMERYPHEFSGGQRQRIAIARALVVEPMVLIADEPVSALDLTLQIKILNLLSELKKKLDLTLFIISHDLKKVSGLCDLVAVMYLGRIVETIPGGALFSKSLHPYTRALIDSIPVTDPQRRKERGPIVTGEVATPMETHSGCAFYPRCPRRMNRCQTSIPRLESTENERHSVACFLF